MAKALGESENTSLCAWRARGGAGGPAPRQHGAGRVARVVEEGAAGLAVSPQVRLALQVPGQWAVAADRPEGGEGDLGDPHARALRRRRVDDQVQRAVPHRRESQLGLLQGPDREQPGAWTLHESVGSWGKYLKTGGLWEKQGGWGLVLTPWLHPCGHPPATVPVSVTLTGP